MGGTGTINGLVTINTGTSLGPAGRNAFGTLRVNGDLNLSGALSFELDNQLVYDKLILNGILNAASTSSLNVGITEAFPLRPGIFRVMTFNGMTGSLGSVSLPSSQGLAASYVLGSNYIDIIFSQLAYGTNPLLTGNYSIIASAIDNAVLRSAVPGDLLETLNRQPSIVFFKEVMDELLPTCYYGWYPAAVAHADSTTQVISDRLSQQPERVKGAWDPYVMTRRQESSFDATEMADYTNFDTTSVLAGMDMLIAPKLLAGGFLDYSTTHTDLNQLYSASTTDSVTGGIYGQYRVGEVEIQAIGFAGYDQYDSKRNVERTKLSQWANGSTKGRRLGANVGAAYTRKFKWLDVTPSLGVQVLDWSANGFMETEGKEASLRIKKQYEFNFSGRAGVRFAQTFSIKRGFIRPFVNVGYRHYFNDETRKIKGEAFGEPISVKVPSVQKSAVRFDSGVDWSVANKVTMQVRYTTENGGPSDESVGLSCGVNVAF
ncbi:MAG: autotransporter outer membrane beta-barrel domain-containing protein [Nibricoccus sp.]